MAQELADQECEACTSEDEPLSEDEYAEYLGELDGDARYVEPEPYPEPSLASPDDGDGDG